MQRSRKNEAMRDIFTGWSEIAGAESVQRIADAVDIVEQFAQHAAPGVRARQRVVHDQGEAMQVALQVDRHAIVAGAVVGAKNGDIRNIRLLGSNVARVKW